MQWHLAAQPSNPHPLGLELFLSQLLAFLNSHIACKDENTLAVFGVFPGRRLVPLLWSHSLLYFLTVRSDFSTEFIYFCH